jgi:hypothetical protein
MKAILCTLSLSILLLFCSISLFAVVVTGTIVGSDAPFMGLADATIVLEGFNNYTATTNAQGQFTIPDVVANNTYTYTASREDYHPATGEINVGTSNLNMGNVMLNEIANPPTNAQAFVVEPNVRIRWTHIMGALGGYKVWRLHAGDELNEQYWTLLTPNIIVADSMMDTHWYSLPDGSYQWAVKAVISGNVLSEAAFTNTLENTTAVDDNPAVPPYLFNGFEYCYPNPFKDKNSIRYCLRGDKSPLLMEIFNLRGQKITTLVNAVQDRGSHYAVWNATNDQNKPVSPGVYLYKMSSGKFTASKKVILVK